MFVRATWTLGSKGIYARWQYSVDNFRGHFVSHAIAGNSSSSKKCNPGSKKHFLMLVLQMQMRFIRTHKFTPVSDQIQKSFLLGGKFFSIDSFNSSTSYLNDRISAGRLLIVVTFFILTLLFNVFTVVIFLSFTVKLQISYGMYFVYASVSCL